MGISSTRREYGLKIRSRRHQMCEFEAAIHVGPLDGRFCQGGTQAGRRQPGGSVAKAPVSKAADQASAKEA
jgi:hypothetical protein